MRKFLDREYQNYIPYIFSESDEPFKPLKTLTFQVTDNCNLCCSYCYQINKHAHMMNFDIAKKVIDYLFTHRQDPNFYFNEFDTPGLIVEFIGGEPLLAWDLIEQIVEYFEIQFYSQLPTEHKWILFHQYSLCSNGILYFNNRFQNYRQKYPNAVQVGITVDGNKELHDRCRLDEQGNGSYDRAIAAATHNLTHYNMKETKITFSPENIAYVKDAIVNMIEQGFDFIQANPIHEEGWTVNDGKIFYKEAKRLVDWLYKNDFQDKVWIRFLDAENYQPAHDDKNWCGATSCMLAVDYKGNFYPCIRFMESSLGDNIPPYMIGDINTGPFNTAQGKQIKEDLEKVTRTSQSPEKCLKCTIASGCSWCSGYNYQKFGTVNQRATYICPIHIASALATIYLHKKENLSYNQIVVPKEQALEIISEEEYNYLFNIKEV